MYTYNMTIRRPLSPVILHILLALGDLDRHGYEIMKQVGIDSGGSVRLAAGTLYDAIHRLVLAGLLVESEERPAPEHDDSRRRYYKLTESGRRLLADEIASLEAIVTIGSTRLRQSETMRGALA